MKMMKKIHSNYVLDIMYYTLLFLVVSICIQQIIHILPQLLNLNGVYYLIVVGVMWIIVSAIVGLLFKVGYTKKQLFGIGENKKSISSNLLYSFSLLAIVTITISLIYTLRIYMFSETIENVTKEGMAELSNINDFDNMVDLSVYLIGIAVSIVLNATGEELFIRYVAYNELAKRNSGRELNVKFVITSLLAFVLFHIGALFSLDLLLVFFSSSFAALSFSLIFIKTKNIVYPIIMHSMWNFFAMIDIRPILNQYALRTFNGLDVSKFIENYTFPLIFIFFALVTYLYIFVKSKMVKTRK